MQAIDLNKVLVYHPPTLNYTAPTTPSAVGLLPVIFDLVHAHVPTRSVSDPPTSADYRKLSLIRF